MLGILLISIGFVLLIAECIIPGFGPLVIAGIVLIFFGAWLLTKNVFYALLICIVLSAIGLLIGFALLKRFKRSKYYESIKLNQNSEHNYIYSSIEVGLKGRTVSALRPIGVAKFGDKKLHVKSDGGFVDANVMVRVKSTDSSVIIVERIDYDNVD